MYIKKLIICWNGEQKIQEGDSCSIDHLLIFMFKRSDKEKGFKYRRGVLMRGERRMRNVHT